MSLRGRFFIDRLKTRVGRWLKLPCPPYSSTRYWEGVYNSLGPHDVYEWGSLTLNDTLLEYDYQLLDPATAGAAADKGAGSGSTSSKRSTFAEAIGIEVTNDDDDDCHRLDVDSKPILFLGCGNSKLGEDMAEQGWRGPLIQVDVVPKVLETMVERCSPLVQEGIMDFVEDDATQLSAFEDNTISAVIDKGLVDALFCADDYKQVRSVVNSVHRVLKPQGIFCLFSLSHPEFLMPKVCNDLSIEGQWKNVQVRQLESILMYRFQKDDVRKRPRTFAGPTKEALQRKRKRQSKSKR